MEFLQLLLRRHSFPEETSGLTNDAAKILITLPFLLQLDWRSLGHNHSSRSCVVSAETSHAMSRNTTRDRKGAPYWTFLDILKNYARNF